MKKIIFLKPLDILNNIRFNYIKKNVKINKKTILDIGCGVGSLSEKLAMHGGIVTGIDNSEKLINIAKKKATYKNLSITYQFTNLKDFFYKSKNTFDIIISMELIEHLKEKKDMITLLTKASHTNTSIFLSSLNRNITTYINIIFFGEYILNKLTKRTHMYEQFIDVYDFKKLIDRFFFITDIKGFSYYPILENANLLIKFNINYIIYAKKKKI